jgi:hypothetical protein
MTAIRFMPLPIHAALEMLAGLALGIAPFALGLGAGASIVGVVAGALIVGLALQSLDIGTGSVLHVAAHHAADQGVALGLATAAAIMASAGEGVAAALFAAAAGAQIVLLLVTRYTAR